MLIFACDCALARCSVALVRGETTLARMVEDREKGHAERIAPMAQAAFEEARLDPQAIERIGVVVGPGGFTGVRVGLAFARGLALATRARAVGVTSLAALAETARSTLSDPVAAVIDARRGGVYAALFDVDGSPLVAPFLAEPQACLAKLKAGAAGASFAVVGSGAPLLGADRAIEAIDPLAVARIAARAPAPDRPPAPLYLREPDAKPQRVAPR